MTRAGPLLERLTHHLSECPAEFLDEPRLGQRGLIHVDAVVSDLMMNLGGDPLSEKGSRTFRPGDKKRRNFLRLVLVCTWLLHDEWFREKKRFVKPVYTWLKTGLDELARLVAADLFVTDPDRREELVRLCLETLDLRPQGETEAQAADRLNTLSSVERSKVVKATKAAQERARKIREAMQKKKAREAAAKPMHE